MTRLLAREPLTVTELANLAIRLHSGSTRMAFARIGEHFVWTGDTDVHGAYEDMFAAFYQLQTQAAEADPAAYRVNLA